MSIENLSGIAIFLVMLFVVELFPITFAQTSWKCVHRKVVNGKVKVRPIPSAQKIWYFLPISCVCMTYKSFFKKCSFTQPLAIIASVLMSVRIFMFLPFMDALAVDNVVLRVIYMFSVPILLLGLLIFHILHAIVYYKISTLFQFGIFTKILIFIVPYAVAANFNSQIPLQLFADKEQLSNRFDENYHKKSSKKSATKSAPTKVSKTSSTKKVVKSSGKRKVTEHVSRDR